MAVKLGTELTLLQAKFEAEVASLTWKLVADTLSRPPTKRLRPPRHQAVKRSITDKEALFRDYLTRPESGWWTRDDKKYYRFTVMDKSGEICSFRLFGDEDSHHPITVKFSTLVNRWRFKTNEELSQS